MQIWLQVSIGIPAALQSFLQLLLPQRAGHNTAANPPRPILLSSVAQLDWQVGLVGAAFDVAARFENEAKAKSAASTSGLRILHRLVVICVFIFPPV